MKKYLITIIALSLALFIGCSKEDECVANKELKISFAIADMPDYDPNTRAVKAGWETGDQVLIVFEGKDGWLNAENWKNNITLTYWEGAWDIQNNLQDVESLKSGRQFTAIHFPGNKVYLGEYDDYIHGTQFNSYYGGEQLRYTGTYTIENEELSLGTVTLARDDNDFQISIKGLVEYSNSKELVSNSWVLTICDNTDGVKSDKITITHHQAGNLYLKDNGQLANYAEYIDANGIEYKGDVSFYFSKVDLNASTIVFLLEYLYDDSHKYYITLNGATSNTLQGGNAYTLPAIGNWTKK